MARRKKAQTRRSKRQTAQQLLAEVRGLVEAGNYEAAERRLSQHARALEGQAEAHFLKGRMHWMCGRPAKAEAEQTRAIELAPDVGKYHNDRGLARRSQFRYFEASLDFLNALRVEPGGREAMNNLATNYIDIGDSDGAVTCFSAMLERDPGYALGYSNLLFTMNYLDSKSQAELFEATRGFAERFEEADAKPAYPTDKIDADPDRRLRIGFISADMRDHPVVQFLMPLLENLDPDAFEVTCYSNLPPSKADAKTEQVKATSARWREVYGRPDADLVRQIVRDRIDVAIDLSGHTAGNRLRALAKRPAPVQATWLGYPNTTGLNAVDYRLTDAVVEPGFGEHTSERPVVLDGGFHCYRPSDGAPEVSPLPAKRNGHITFGSMNNLAKVTPTCFRMWAAILREMPTARLKFKARGVADSAVAERIRQTFEEAGIDPDRLDFLPFTREKVDHLALFRDIDIALDSAPYTGTTTTCDSLWMGVPVITMAGDTPAARVSASLMNRVGLEPLVADGEESYVKHAVELASDVDRLADLRAAIRPAFEDSPLRDETGFAAKFEVFLRQAWQAWCAETKETGDAEAPTLVRAPEDTQRAPARPAPAPATEDTREPPPEQIRVLHHLARTGGTLISKCLGSMDGVVLLSEAHPNGLDHIDAVEQARAWFGLIDAAEAQAIREARDPFGELIQTAAARCAAQGRHLVVRDWTHLDYTGTPFVAHPPYRLTTAEALAGRFATVTKTATVRHPVDQWLSLNRLQIIRGRLSVRDYLRGYRAFAEAAAEMGFLRYEDFTAEPDASLRALCARLDLPFDAGFATRWPSYRKITGDTVERSATATEIRPSRPKAHDAELIASFEACPDYAPALELLGYAPATAAAEAAAAG